MRLAVAAYDVALGDGFPVRAGGNTVGARAEASRRLGLKPAALDHILRRAKAKLGIEPDPGRYRPPPSDSPTPVPDRLHELPEWWRKRRCLNGDFILEEAHRYAADGLGRVIDDGHPPAIWEPGVSA